MHRRLSLTLVAVALCCAAPAAALEHSGILREVEQAAVYRLVNNSFALHRLINRSLPALAKGDAWDKLILGVRYKALADWRGTVSRGLAPPPPESESPGMDGAVAPPPAPRPMQPRTDLQAAPQMPADYAQQAVTWLKAAAAEGLSAVPGTLRSDNLPYGRAGSLAAAALGEIYGFGIEPGWLSKGIAPDYVEAYVWFNVAAAQNEDKAAQNLAEVTARLSADERAEAERRLQALKSRQGT